MKPTNLLTGRVLLVLLATGLTIGLVSWDYKQSPGRYQQSANDTTPKKKTGDSNKKVRDLDDVLEELDNADLNVDFDKVRIELAEALKKLDGAKIKLDIEKAMKDVDLVKIQKDVQESLAKVDFDKIKVELAEALKEVDMAKIQKDVQESLAKADFDKIKVEMEKIREIDMKKLDADMKKLGEEMKELGPKLEKDLEKAKAEIEKAKTQIKELKTFVDGLDADGLINKKENYTLKHKEGELFINDKKASIQTYNKYRSFLEKYKKFDIEKSEDDFDIDID